MKFNRNKHN